MIVLEDVTKTYLLGEEQIVAVDNLRLRVQSGEFVAVMGKSGCGKTTLLSLIGGLDRPDSGRILVNGQDITRLGDGELTRYRRDQV
ncbi:MAG: transporter ATPase, partial [Deltaproteobacteria bacterium]|nr:transporter ATPase [Deltaproteobacteria bacterium]